MVIVHKSNGRQSGESVLMVDSQVSDVITEVIIKIFVSIGFFCCHQVLQGGSYLQSAIKTLLCVHD